MPWIRLNNFEYAGFVADVDAHLLPPNKVSRLENAHCDDGVLERYRGYQEILDDSDRLLYLLSGGFSTPWLVGASADKLYSLTLAAASDITPAGGLTGVVENDLVGGVLHGIAVLTNGSDVPQYWAGSGDFADLTNWVSDETCKMIRPYKNFLFAGNITDSGGTYPTKLKWSNAADPGSVPTSWAEDDPTEDSGSITLSDTPGAIVDGCQSGESFFVYKEDAIYELEYIGGVYIFNSTPRFYNIGVMTRNCVLSHRNLSYMFGQDDLVVHTKNQMKSIATKAVRRRLFNGLSSSYRSRVFAVYDAFYGEILFCVPWNSEYVDYAFTYNPTTDRWGERELPQITCATTGKTLNIATSWDSDSDTWDSDTTIWGESILEGNYTFLGGDVLYGLNQTEELNGSPMTAVMERKSIDFGSEQNPNERIKFVSLVRPNVIADVGVEVQVQIGTQMKLGDPVNWSAARTFTVGTTRDLHFRENGRYISWRVSSTGSDRWRLESIDFEVKMGALW